MGYADNAPIITDQGRPRTDDFGNPVTGASVGSIDQPNWGRDPAYDFWNNNGNFPGLTDPSYLIDAFGKIKPEYTGTNDEGQSTLFGEGIDLNTELQDLSTYLAGGYSQDAGFPQVIGGRVFQSFRDPVNGGYDLSPYGGRNVAEMAINQNYGLEQMQVPGYPQQPQTQYFFGSTPATQTSTGQYVPGGGGGGSGLPGGGGLPPPGGRGTGFCARFPQFCGSRGGGTGPIPGAPAGPGAPGAPGAPGGGGGAPPPGGGAPPPGGGGGGSSLAGTGGGWNWYDNPAQPRQIGPGAQQAQMGYTPSAEQAQAGQANYNRVLEQSQNPQAPPTGYRGAPAAYGDGGASQLAAHGAGHSSGYMAEPLAGPPPRPQGGITAMQGATFQQALRDPEKYSVAWNDPRGINPMTGVSNAQEAAGQPGAAGIQASPQANMYSADFADQFGPSGASQLQNIAARSAGRAAGGTGNPQFESNLTRLIENGTITQQQADQLRTQAETQTQSARDSRQSIPMNTPETQEIAQNAATTGDWGNIAGGSAFDTYLRSLGLEPGRNVDPSTRVDPVASSYRDRMNATMGHQPGTAGGFLDDPSSLFSGGERADQYNSGGSEPMPDPMYTEQSALASAPPPTYGKPEGSAVPPMRQGQDAYNQILANQQAGASAPALPASPDFTVKPSNLPGGGINVGGPPSQGSALAGGPTQGGPTQADQQSNAQIAAAGGNPGYQMSAGAGAGAVSDSPTVDAGGIIRGGPFDGMPWSQFAQTYGASGDFSGQGSNLAGDAGAGGVQDIGPGTVPGQTYQPPIANQQGIQVPGAVGGNNSVGSQRGGVEGDALSQLPGVDPTQFGDLPNVNQGSQGAVLRNVTDEQIQQYLDLYSGAGVKPAGMGFQDPTDFRGNVADLLGGPLFSGDPFHLPGQPTATGMGLQGYYALGLEQKERAESADDLMRQLAVSMQGGGANQLNETMLGELRANPFTTSSPELRNDIERRATEGIESGRQAGEQALGDAGLTAGPAGTEAMLALQGDANRQRTDTMLGIEDEFTRRRAQDISESMRMANQGAETTAGMVQSPMAGYAAALRTPLEPYRPALSDYLMQLGTLQSEKALALRNTSPLDYAMPLIGSILGGLAGGGSG